jgi:hypothetical protein
VAFAFYLLIVACASALPRRLLWAAVGIGVALFALAPPLLSQDVFSYVSYARLDAEYGLNPYHAVPADVPADAAFRFVGWRDAVSAYGPLFTLATYPLGLVSVAVALWTLKAVAALSLLAVAALVARLAALRGVDPRTAVALVALNPLVLVHVVGGAHNDGLMMIALLAGIMALLLGTELRAGAALATGVAIKVSAAFAAPYALLAARRPSRLAVGGALGLAAIGLAGLAVFGGGALESLGLAGENQAATSRYSVPATLSRLLGVDVDALRAFALLGFAALVAWLLLRTARGGDWIRAAGWTALGLLLATGWLLPWYVVWALPLAAIAADGALVVSVLALCAFQLINRVPL